MFDSSVLYKPNPKWTKEDVLIDCDTSVASGEEGTLSSDEDDTCKKLEYDSDETFIYHDDGNLSDYSATETDSDLPSIADVDHSDNSAESDTETESDTSLPIPPVTQDTKDLSLTLTETTSVTATVKISKKMDIISISQDTSLKRLLEVDVSDLIDDPDMKREMKFFRELKMKEESGNVDEYSCNTI